MKKLLLLPLLVICGCATSPLSGLVTLKAAEQIKAADRITGIEKVADTANAQIGSGNESNKINTTTRAGRDISQGSGNTMTNDSEIMKDYIKLMKYMIKLLAGIVSVQFATMMGLIGWVIKFLLKQDSKKDEFMERLLNKK